MDLLKIINHKLSRYRSPLKKIQNINATGTIYCQDEKIKDIWTNFRKKNTENKTNNKVDQVKDMLQKYINGENDFIRKINNKNYNSKYTHKYLTRIRKLSRMCDSNNIHIKNKDTQLKTNKYIGKKLKINWFLQHAYSFWGEDQQENVRV